jgi:hypothetical protein
MLDRQRNIYGCADVGGWLFQVKIRLTQPQLSLVGACAELGNPLCSDQFIPEIHICLYFAKSTFSIKTKIYSTSNFSNFNWFQIKSGFLSTICEIKTTAMRI